MKSIRPHIPQAAYLVRSHPYAKYHPFHETHSPAVPERMRKPGALCRTSNRANRFAAGLVGLGRSDWGGPRSGGLRCTAISRVARRSLRQYHGAASVKARLARLEQHEWCLGLPGCNHIHAGARRQVQRSVRNHTHRRQPVRGFAEAAPPFWRRSARGRSEAGETKLLVLVSPGILAAAQLRWPVCPI